MVQPLFLGYGQSLLAGELSFDSHFGRLSLLDDPIRPLLTFGDVTYIVCCLINSLLRLIAAVLDKVFEHHLSKMQSRNLATLMYRDIFRESW